MTHYPWQFPNEVIKYTDKGVIFLPPQKRCVGHVFVTQFRFRFEENGDVNRAWIVDVPLGRISKVDKLGYSSMAQQNFDHFNFYGVQLVCKDMRDVRLSFDPVRHQRRGFVKALSDWLYPITSNTDFYAVVYSKYWKAAHGEIDGWTLFDTKREMQRLGIPNDLWSISAINQTYDYSDTYPRCIVIPKAVEKKGKDFISKIGDFRSKKRIPVLSWLHPITGASITRSAQPLSGMTNRKSNEDEAYLKMIMYSNPHAHQLLIYDARPIVNAKVNRAKGGGYEENYEQCPITFLNIHNIHAVRESLRKLKESLYPRVDEMNWLKQLDDCKWLYHIQSIIEGAAIIARQVEVNKESVLVHCSDGWDRTAQLTSLSMMQLDPYYRTIEGFAVLIEKEWCSFGHKFGHRIGHGEPPNDERSPVFLQFIDCVWQLMQQYPDQLEFTDELLIFILDELYDCRFGTFLYNSEKQRLHEKKCNKETVSIWTYVMANQKRFFNPLYWSDFHKKERRVLIMNYSIKVLKLWKDYYARYNPNVVAPGSREMKRYGVERAIGYRALLTELVNVQDSATGVPHSSQFTGVGDHF